jgi:hypothetical protein
MANICDGPNDDGLGLHEMAALVKRLSCMQQYSKNLLDSLDDKLKITGKKAPVGRQSRGQTYKLQCGERRVPRVEERRLEQLLWMGWSFQAVAIHRQPFLGHVCRFIQTYQMPLQGTRRIDPGWGKIDLVGATTDALPVVIELKKESATDPPLRMLVEGLAYACAVRKAWAKGGLRAEWTAAMKMNGFYQELPTILPNVPLILIAPADFWKRKIGRKGVRSTEKVKEEAWPVFLELVQKCADHGFPIHFIQFQIGTTGEPSASTVSNVSLVRLPGAGSLK